MQVIRTAHLPPKRAVGRSSNPLGGIELCQGRIPPPRVALHLQHPHMHQRDGLYAQWELSARLAANCIGGKGYWEFQKTPAAEKMFVILRTEIEHMVERNGLIHGKQADEASKTNANVTLYLIACWMDACVGQEILRLLDGVIAAPE